MHSAELVFSQNLQDYLSYLSLPLLQDCAHFSLLSIGPCHVPQTIGLQGVGTCMWVKTNTQMYSALGNKKG